MKTFLRQLVVCALPLFFAAGSGYYFTTIQGSCGAMVGALFSGKCAGRQRQYLARFQLGGGAAGTVIAATPAAAVEVTEAVVAKTVVDRQPQDTGSTFTADVGQVVCWTKVGGAEGSSIHHVWFHGDTQVGDVELQVGGSPWRTWSKKSVPADWTGAWHVEVRDAAGTVLKRLDFTVGQ